MSPALLHSILRVWNQNIMERSEMKGGLVHA
jgi:hypothetical protein